MYNVIHNALNDYCITKTVSIFRSYFKMNFLFWAALNILSVHSMIPITRSRFEFPAKYSALKNLRRGLLRSLSMNSDSLDTVCRTVGHFSAIKHMFICADQSKPKCCNYEV